MPVLIMDKRCQYLSAEFIPLGEEGNQVNVFANYTVNDPTLVNPKISSVMKVYHVPTIIINPNWQYPFLQLFW
jgi:hypothetical protein